EQVKALESLVDAAVPPPAPVVTSSPSPLVPAGTYGGEASQPADSEATGNGKGNGTNQGQGQEKHDDGATPTSEPTPEPSDPADPSPTPSPDPTPSPSPDANDHAPHGKSPTQDSDESTLGVGGPAAATPSAKVARGKLPPGSQGQHKGVQKPTADQAESREPAEQAAPMTVP
ncbi:MAG TPA: hypothetical protein VII16_07780, partial [Actinomycetes bacterium]